MKSKKITPCNNIRILHNGFYSLGQLPYGIDGQTQLQMPEGLLGRFSYAVTAGMPEYVYATLGLVVIGQGIKKVKEKGQRMWGAAQTAAGMILLNHVGDYMELALDSPSRGMDYHEFARAIFGDIPNSSAKAVTLVGIASIFAAVYVTSGKIAERLDKQ